MHATRRPLAALSLFAMAAATATWASAQNQLAPDAQLQKDHNEAMRVFPKLRSGEQQPAAGDKEKIIDAEARYLVYRFASSTVQTWEKMAQLRRDIDLQIGGALTA